MKIYHYYPRERAIRFLRSTPKYFRNEFNCDTDMYLHKWDAHDFLNSLLNRIKYPDITLITAHGQANAIIKLRKNECIPKLSTKEALYFENNFILAICCFTALRLGVYAIRRGALCYIGFNQSVMPLFQVGIKTRGVIRNNIELIYKKIVKESLCIEFSRFIKSCLTSQEFYENLCWRIKHEINICRKSSIDQMNTKYSTNFRKEHISEVNQILRLELIDKFNKVEESMKLLGESSYIPWFYLKDLSKDELLKRLKYNEVKNQNNLYYKFFVDAIIFKLLKDDVRAVDAIYECERELKRLGKEFIYPSIFNEEVAFVKSSDI